MGVDIQRLRKFLETPALLTLWFVWVIVASAITWIMGVAALWQTIASGQFPADATMAEQLSGWSILLIALCWLPPLTVALVLRRESRADLSGRAGEKNS
jgi:hypothetical protein